MKTTTKVPQKSQAMNKYQEDNVLLEDQCLTNRHPALQEEHVKDNADDDEEEVFSDTGHSATYKLTPYPLLSATRRSESDSPIGSPILRTAPVNKSIFRHYGPRLERESSSLAMLFILGAISIHLELVRQVCSYAIKYHNNDVYPIPSTFLVFATELIKFTIFAIKLLQSNRLGSVNVSFTYLIPSTLYALNNNIYFIALYFTTPPVWNILMQSRVLFTALVYRFHFKKTITSIQWLGLILLTLAIVVLQFSKSEGGMESDSGILSWNIIVALGMAAMASVFSAVGPVYAEYLLKHDKRSFDDKQLQMYLFGTLITGAMFMTERFRTVDDFTPMIIIYGDVYTLASLTVACVGCTVLSGIVYAIIIKKLDNIVKLYTQALSNAMTALACIVFFPRAFQFDIVFVISLLTTLFSVYLYETKALPCRPNTKQQSES